MTAETQSGDDLDIQALADAWLGEPKEEPTSEDTTEPSGEGGVQPETPEAPNGDPTPQVAQITPEQEEEIFNRRLNQQLESARQAKAQKDLQNLIETGTDEDIAKWTREEIQRNQAQAARDAIAHEAATNSTLEIVNHLLNDEFINSLTPEEARSLLPDNFKTDREYISALQNMTVQKARSGLYTEEDVQRLVDERIKAAQNVRRGQQFQSPSPTQTPNALPNEDRHAGLEGNAYKDSLWQEIAEKWTDEN